MAKSAWVEKFMSTGFGTSSSELELGIIGGVFCSMWGRRTRLFLLTVGVESDSTPEVS